MFRRNVWGYNAESVCDYQTRTWTLRDHHSASKEEKRGGSRGSVVASTTLLFMRARVLREMRKSGVPLISSYEPRSHSGFVQIVHRMPAHFLDRGFLCSPGSALSEIDKGAIRFERKRPFAGHWTTKRFQLELS